MNLDQQQLEAVTAGTGPFEVVAAAGSGKTRCLTERIVHLIEQGEPQSSIVAVTFTKAAAQEMLGRVAKRLDVPAEVLKVKICTLHSLGLSILFQNSKALGYRNQITVSDARCAGVLRHLLRDRNKSYQGMDYALARAYIAAAKRADLAPADLADATRDRRLVQCYADFERAKLEESLVQFDDMVFKAWRLIRDNVEVREKYQKKFRWVLVDECHDTDLVQLRLCMALAAPEHNIWIVDDIRQCQPPGTMVEVFVDKNHGGHCKAVSAQVPIVNLTETDRVISWTQHDQRCYKSGRAIKICRRQYTGPLLKISQGDHDTLVTPQHKFWAQFNDRAKKGLCCVYLMFKEGLGFRVGWCTVWYKGLHLGQRARIETADAAWILKTFNERKWASAYESVVACKYGIPQVMFHDVKATHLYDREVLDYIFGAVNSLDGGRRCLKDHGKLETHPFWSPLKNRDEENKGHFHGYFRVAAANLIPDIMDLPTRKSFCKASITSISSSHYNGDVYSLDVEHDHTYIADGIPTCNSIYSFRGAQPELCQKFTEEFYPGAKQIFVCRNYRSRPAIIELFKEVIEASPFATQEFLDAVQPTREQGDRPAPKFVRFLNDLQEAEYVAQEIKSIRAAEPQATIAVLYRMNRQSRMIEETLLHEKITYVVRGAASFFRLKEVQAALAFLAFIEDHDDDNAVKEIMLASCPASFGLGKNATDALALQSEHWFGALLRYPFQRTQIANAAARLYNTLDMLLDSCNDTMPVDKQLVCIYNRTGLLREDDAAEVSGDNDRSENLRELLRAAAAFGSRKEFLAYAKSFSGATNASGAVELLTIHRAKGLQYQHVFLVGADDEVLPHKYAVDPEEERRLAYVAVSRAEEQVYVLSNTLPSGFFKRWPADVKLLEAENAIADK